MPAMLRIADVRNQRISAKPRKRMLVFIDEPFHLAAQFRSDRARRRNQQPCAERLGESGGMRHALCERCNGVHTTMLARARLGVVRAWGWRARDFACGRSAGVTEDGIRIVNAIDWLLGD